MNIPITTTVDEQCAIRVFDEYYHDLPQDLYIPPQAFAILLEQFEGPLDFLLYLVQKSGFDLKNLDIAPIAQQYLRYIDSMKNLNIELTADYLLMAALLADLKSRLLLPKKSPIHTEDDPKKELVSRLEQYLLIKQAAQNLSSCQILERDVFEARVHVSAHDIVYEDFDVNMLHDAMLCVFFRPEPLTHQVNQDVVHLEERIQSICNAVAQGGVFQFEELLNPSQGRMGLVVTFMAILELAKQQHIDIIHDGIDRSLSIQGKHYAQSSFS